MRTRRSAAYRAPAPRHRWRDRCRAAGIARRRARSGRSRPPPTALARTPEQGWLAQVRRARRLRHRQSASSTSWRSRWRRCTTRFKFELVVLVGDNLYGSERPQDFKKKFEIPYKPLLDAGVKFYASLGNHDAREQRYYKLFNMDGKLVLHVQGSQAERAVLRAREHVPRYRSRSRGSRRS